MSLIGLVKDLNTGWWIEFEKALQNRDLEYRLIDIERHDWPELVEPCSHVIWRPNLSEPFLRQAREKLYFISQILGKEVYPNNATFWHYDNKNAQQYLAEYFDLPFPKTFVSYSYEDAREFLKTCSFPIISKSAAGAGSRNVRLLKSEKQALAELEYLFRKSFRAKAVSRLIAPLDWKHWRYGGQRFYVFYQEFLKNNEHDTRVVTIGDKILALRRRNRKDDFRASGSGLLEYDPKGIDQRMLTMARDLSARFCFQSMAYDFLMDNEGNPVFGEMSYTFPGGAFLGDCPGYWDSELHWHEGKQNPQELVIESLVESWNL